MSGFNDKEWYEKNSIPPILEEENEAARKLLTKAERNKIRAKRRKEEGKCPLCGQDVSSWGYIFCAPECKNKGKEINNA